MHLSTATVLSTLAVAGNVAASNLQHGHAQFHAKRDVEKRQYENVDWAKALKDVDWSTVKFDGAKSAPAPTQAAAAPAKQPDVAVAAAAKPTPSSKPEPSSDKPAPSGSSSYSKDVSAFSRIGVKDNSGLNAEKEGKAMWLGNDGRYKATFTNDADKAVAIICWNKLQMWINVHQPEIFVSLPKGQSVTVSIPPGQSGGCGAALPDSTMFMGLLNESLLEFTAKDNNMGCHDISREVNMNGLVLTSKGSVCTSGLVNGKYSCLFACKDDPQRCGDVHTYKIVNDKEYSANLGPCMIGKDPHDGGVAGGCQFGSNGEHLQVTVSGHRNWPPLPPPESS